MDFADLMKRIREIDESSSEDGNEDRAICQECGMNETACQCTEEQVDEAGGKGIINEASMTKNQALEILAWLRDQGKDLERNRTASIGRFANDVVNYLDQVMQWLEANAPQSTKLNQIINSMAQIRQDAKKLERSNAPNPTFANQVVNDLWSTMEWITANVQDAKKAIEGKGVDELDEYFEYEPSKNDGKPDDVLSRRTPGAAGEDPESYKHMARTKDKNYPLGGPKGELPESYDEEELDECGDMGPTSPGQPDSVSMNVSMSGSGKGGIRDLMSILSKIDTTDSSDDHSGKMNLIGNDLEEFANEPDEMVYPVDSVLAKGNDLHSHGDNEVPRAHGGGNPYSMLKNKLESLYHEIKTKGTL